jgi:vacuolar-type H+-ATPase subunit F/Vma7
MRTCTVIADADAVVGFRLAGVEAAAASGPGEAERLLRERIAAGGSALVLVDQDFLDGFSPAMRQTLDRTALPLVVPIPISAAGWGAERSGDYILGLIRRAIGFQMKIAGR